MRTVETFPDRDTADRDNTLIAARIAACGWQHLTTVTDHTTTSTWQHPDHRHEVVVTYANLPGCDQWARTIEIIWWRWPEQLDEPHTHTFRLPADAPVEAACESWDGQPITLPTVIAMCGVVDLRDVA